ncbi:MAG: DUF1080 domain-containing protein [Akkermansiaceae bacterium]|jgi:hypothetical protein
MKHFLIFLFLLTAPLHSSEWVSLFNGRDLSGWTIKIAKHPLGADPFQTFRVEDGILKCEYDKYPKFDKQFGHLYSNLAYSHYLLRLEYKFVGKRMADAPGYVNLNSGIMVHSQPPQSMSLDQGFPVSMEFQFLADEGKGPRPTGNVCTPGTNLEIDGKLVTKHIVQSSAENLPADKWVKIEIEVRGSSEIIHRVEGKEVLRYQKPQLDPKGAVVPTKDLLEAGAPLLLSHGHIALQAEGQPVWFRNIELKQLEATPVKK